MLPLSSLHRLPGWIALFMGHHVLPLMGVEVTASCFLAVMHHRRCNSADTSSQLQKLNIDHLREEKEEIVEMKASS